MVDALNGGDDAHAMPDVQHVVLLDTAPASGSARNRQPFGCVLIVGSQTAACQALRCGPWLVRCGPWLVRCGLRGARYVRGAVQRGPRWCAPGGNRLPSGQGFRMLTSILPATGAQTASVERRSCNRSPHSLTAPRRSASADWTQRHQCSIGVAITTPMFHRVRVIAAGPGRPARGRLGGIH
jgi:hypothetical protein